jgi:hypothetical protein
VYPIGFSDGDFDRMQRHPTASMPPSQRMAATWNMPVLTVQQFPVAMISHTVLVLGISGKATEHHSVIAAFE